VKGSSTVEYRELVGAGVVRFLVRNLEDILLRHERSIPAQPLVELKLLLDATIELPQTESGRFQRID